MKIKKTKLRVLSSRRVEEEPVRKKKKKRPVEVEDDDLPIKKKKKKQVEQVTIEEGPALGKPPKAKLVKPGKKVVEQIAIAPELRQQAIALYKDIKDDETASVHMQELAYMLKANARIIRITTNAIEANADRVDSRLIYALMTTMSQQREVIADIRMVSDSGKQLDLIHSKILQPAAIEQAGVLTGMFYQLRRLLTETSKEDQAQFAIRQLESIMNDVARNTQAGYEAMNAKIQAALTAT